MSQALAAAQPMPETPNVTLDVSVVIPVHNEREAIAEDLRVIQQSLSEAGHRFEIIVVDDGSTDDTAEIVAGLDGVRLIRHQTNRGTGAALKTGITAARAPIIIMTDGDGTYPNHEMPALLRLLEQYDMVIGARRHERGTLRFLRTPTKAFIRTLASYLTQTPIPDLNSGLRAFRRDAAIRFFRLLPAGHSWVSTITLAFLSNGYTVGFMPIDYYARKGQSHFHPIRDTYNYLSLVMRTVMYFDPLRFFLPAAFALLAIGFLKTIADVVRFDFHVATSTVLIIVTGIQLGAIGLLADLIVKRTRFE